MGSRRPTKTPADVLADFARTLQSSDPNEAKLWVERNAVDALCVLVSDPETPLPPLTAMGYALRPDKLQARLTSTVLTTRLEGARPSKVQQQSKSGTLGPSSAPKVPTAGETILSYVCSPNRLESILGCLEQHFRKRCTKHGEAAGRRWYYWQVGRSVIWFGIEVLSGTTLIRALLGKLGLGS